MHRDLKAENFFVGRKNVVKLGDFGESTHVPRHTTPAPGGAQKRMTILGTVAFMAPELIAASKQYTEAIDIYALAITLWEIWTGQDPYDDISQFDIYTKVSEGYRPPLPANAPPGFHDVLQAGWHAQAESRPDASRFLTMMQEVRDRFAGGSGGAGDAEGHADDNGEDEGEGGSPPKKGGRKLFSTASGRITSDEHKEAVSDEPTVAQVNPILAARQQSNGSNGSRPTSGTGNGFPATATDIEMGTVGSSRATSAS